MEYVALQVKTSYSILESLNHIPKLVEMAKELGYTSLAITDTNNMFGVMEFYLECNKNDIKPIIGIELKINDSKILLYAKNKDGYKNLIKLSTLISDRELVIDDLVKYKDNLILIMPTSTYDDTIYNIYEDKFIGYSTKEEKVKINKPKVFINDVSYLEKEDYKYLDYLYMIKDGKVIGEYELNTHVGKYLMNGREVESICDIEDIKNTINIANNCNLNIEYTPDLLPIYDKNIDAYEYLRNLCYKGLNKRLEGNVTKEYKNRLDYELDIINKMGFCNYFLIVWDYVKYAKFHDILVGPGRGSAAGSLVSYTLGITDIDPIKYNLLFERFLNPERVTMPDIDIDFDSEKRNEVIEYVIDKYGEKKVAGIITFNTLGAKQVIRDVARVLKVDNNSVDGLAKLIKFDKLEDNYINDKKFKMTVDSVDIFKKIYKIALKLEGLPRHVSIHAAGIVMSRYDIDDTIPLYKNQLGMYVTGYSMNYLEPLGLLKMDFLGLSNLTLIDSVIKEIREKEKLNITFSRIPLDDKRTYEIFKTANTDGIFQFESPGMRSFLKKLQPNNIEDLIAAIALYRPGPMDNIDTYIKRKEGKEQIDYIHKDLEDILKPTYGIIIYQEQIMQIAQVLAGYTLGEADILRRAMSKKKEEILLKEESKFIERSINKGYSKDIAKKVYDLILKFANYGFNRAHSVAYTIIAYKMAFIKTYFFKYFMSNLLTNVIGSDYKTKTYISECRANNLKILLPSINKSTNKYIAVTDGIMCPLSIIRNVGTTITNQIIKEREKGTFTDFIDFVTRTYTLGINRKTITSLIEAGCFNEFNYNKNTLINNLDEILNYAELSKDIGLIEIEKPELVIYEEYPKEYLASLELNTFGFYLNEDPIIKYKNVDDINSLNIPNLFDKRITIILKVNRIKEIVTKKNDVMAFIHASDEYGMVDLTIFPKVYEKYNDIKANDIVKFNGVVERRYDKYQVIVNNLEVLER